MDANHFQRLAKSLVARVPRRHLYALLTALPLAGGLAALLEEDAKAGRRRRRKIRHKRRHDSRERRRKRRGKKENEGQDRRKCAKLGQTPRKGKPCCPGLVLDGAGLCAVPSPPSPPPPPPGCGAGGPCLVFVTSTTQLGNFGGLTQADDICQTRAQEATLPGTYMAWLSDAVASPSTRFPTQSSGPYRLVNGVTVADNWADLTDGTIDNRINVTETGTPNISESVWTNTDDNGGIDPTNNVHCDNWMNPAVLGNIGSSSQTTSAWTDGGTLGCAGARRFYCFQQS